MITKPFLNDSDMHSSFIDFLINDYASHFGIQREDAKTAIRSEIPSSIRFEIEDKKVNIVQPAGHGVSVFRRNENLTEIIDMEAFTLFIHGNGNTPSSCDFVLAPLIGMEYLVLNELTVSKSNLILPFTQPQTGIEQIGKLEKAKKQLVETINRFYQVSNFCDQFNEKVALFSCRLSDKSKRGIMARSAKAFNKTIHMLQKMRIHDSLPHSFIFKMRIYESEYQLN